MKRVLVSSVVMVFLSVGNVKSQGGTWLVDACQSDKETDWGVCLGFINGVATTLDGRNVKGYAKFCLPKRPDGTIFAGPTRDVVKTWLSKNPALLRYSTESLVAKALSDVFPCK